MKRRKKNHAHKSEHKLNERRPRVPYAAVTTKVVPQRNSTKAHATILIGKSLALLGRGSLTVFSSKERECINTRFLLLPSLTPKYLRFQSIKCKTIVTYNNFRQCRVHFYAFVRQPFSKQLYTVRRSFQRYNLHYYLSPHLGLGMRRKLRARFSRSEARSV